MCASASSTARKTDLLTEVSSIINEYTRRPLPTSATVTETLRAAVVVGLVSAFPQLIWLSEHKELVFGTAAFLLGFIFAFL